MSYQLSEHDKLDAVDNIKTRVLILISVHYLFHMEKKDTHLPTQTFLILVMEPRSIFLSDSSVNNVHRFPDRLFLSLSFLFDLIERLLTC